MLKTITKHNYDISYNITDTILTISVKNNENFKKYSSLKTIDEYCVYTDIGLDIFDIVSKSLDICTFTIADNDLHVTIIFTNGKLKIPIKCDIVKDDDESVSEQLNLNKITRELNEYKKTLALLTLKFEEQQKYIDAVIKPLSTYVYVGNQRINKYKKHLVIGSNFQDFFDKLFIKLETFKNYPVPSRIETQDYAGGCNCESSNMLYFKIMNENYNKLDVPEIINIRTIDIEELINIECDILVLIFVWIKNFELLRHFKGNKLYIINCYSLDIQNTEYSVMTEHMVKQFESFSSQLVNLTELVYAPFYQGDNNNQVKFKTGFFKQMKSLKKFVTDKVNTVCSDSDDIMIEYI
jgi:hypothetical protein